MGGDTAVLTDRRVVVAGQNFEQSLPLAHIALVRVRFERIVGDMILAAVAILVAIDPVRGGVAGALVPAHPDGALEPGGAGRARGAEGNEIAQGMQRFVGVAAASPARSPSSAGCCIIAAAAKIALGIIGRTVVTLATSGGEIEFANAATIGARTSSSPRSGGSSRGREDRRHEVPRPPRLRRPARAHGRAEARRGGGRSPARDDRDLRPRPQGGRSGGVVRAAEGPRDPGARQSVRHGEACRAGHGRGVGRSAPRRRQAASVPEGARSAAGVPRRDRALDPDRPRSAAHGAEDAVERPLPGDRVGGRRRRPRPFADPDLLARRTRGRSSPGASSSRAGRRRNGRISASTASR